MSDDNIVDDVVLAKCTKDERYIVWIIFNVVVTYHSITMVKNAFQFIYFSPSLNLNMAYMFLVIPISFALMTIRIIVGYYRQFTGKEEGYQF